MKTKTSTQRVVLLAVFFICAFFTAVGQTTITLNVDATQASRNVLHTKLTIPVAPGPMTLFYPKWIPGEHTPTGPINDLVGLRLTGNGKSIPWRRDERGVRPGRDLRKGSRPSRSQLRRCLSTRDNDERQDRAHQVESSCRLPARNE